MMRIASFLLVAVLMSTCAISGTFAKYVTSDSATDDARVAKWGVTVAVSGNLFGKNYAKKDVAQTGDSIIASTGNSTDITVANKTADKNIVAPGTKNNVGMNIKISGKPEVAYSITAAESGTQSDIYLAEGTYGVMVPAHGLNAATDFVNNSYYTRASDTAPYQKANEYTDGKPYYKLIDQAEVASGGYYPIVWTLTDNNPQSNQTITYTTVANLFNKIDDINTAEAASNVEVDIDYTITWAWAIENGNDGSAKAASNAADTILGHLMAKASTNGYDVVKIDSNNSNNSITTSITTLKLEPNGTTGVTTIKAGESTVGCLTVAFGISVTVAQVD